MTDLLRTRPASTAAMIAIFSDRAVIADALAFEKALARAEAAEGVIGQEAAAAIAAACDALVIDPEALAEDAALAGTLAIPLVARLRAGLPPAIASLVHHGATSQDVADTVLMMQIVRARDALRVDIDRIRRALSALARRHAGTPAIGRTLLQDALPLGFGLRLAQAVTGIDEAASAFDRDVDAHARLQFGGAAGTRAGLDGKGAAVASHMAAELGLADGPPWQARRQGIAAIACSLAILVGGLGKMARDISLLAQNAIGEAREPQVAGRGGSSAMAHKRNPTGCQVALSAALRAPGLASSILAGLPQEQERGLGGWQAEGPVLAELCLLAAGSAAAMADVAEGLEVDEAALARNLAAAGLGADIGESEALVEALLAGLKG